MNQNQFLLSVKLLRETIENDSIYPYSLPVVRYLDTLDFHPQVTFLIGENGTGKSTLLEAIASQHGFNPEGGSKNFNFSTTQTHSILHQNIQLSRGITKPKDGFFLRAETFYNVSTNIDELGKVDNGGLAIQFYGGKSLHEQSHGESFFSLFNHRLFGDGLYMLDEPESALSPQRQLAFLVRMDDLVKQNSQFIIATHSPIILSYPNAKIIQITENGFEELSYKETEHYKTYKDFINNPEYMLSKLGIEN